MTALFASDLIILEAVTWVHRRGETVDLVRLFDIVDAEEHWVPLFGDLNWSLARLVEHGLVTVSEDQEGVRIAPTPAAGALTSAERSQAVPRRSTLDAIVPDDRCLVSGAQYLAAYETYITVAARAAALTDDDVRDMLANARRSVTARKG